MTEETTERFVSVLLKAAAEPPKPQPSFSRDYPHQKIEALVPEFTSAVQSVFQQQLSEIMKLVSSSMSKMDPYHDPHGRFASGGEETEAKSQYYAELEKGKGYTIFFHESPLENYSKINKEGLTDDSNFCTVGEPSGFVSGKKVVVAFRVPNSQLHRVVPDMRYTGLNEEPYSNVLKEHGGVRGSDAAFTGKVPRNWIVDIEKRKSFDPSQLLKLDPYHGEHGRFSSGPGGGTATAEAPVANKPITEGGVDYTSEHGVHVGIFDRPKEAGEDAIAIGTVFHHEPPSMERRHEIAEKFEDSEPRGVEHVALKDLHPMQDTLMRSKLVRPKDPSKSAGKYPAAFEHEGKKYLMDGHHRIGEALYSGQTHADVKMFHIPTQKIARKPVKPVHPDVISILDEKSKGWRERRAKKKKTVEKALADADYPDAAPNLSKMDPYHGTHGYFASAPGGAAAAADAADDKEPDFYPKLRERIAQAPSDKAEIDNVADAIAARLPGARVAKAGVKGFDRAAKKVRDDYKGDAGQISDLARNTIIVKPGDEQAALDSVLKRYPNAKVKRQSPESDPLGYSGILLKVPTKSGYRSEIQINTPAMIYAKGPREMVSGLLSQHEITFIHHATGEECCLGHHYYEEYRELPEGNPNFPIIARQSREYYAKFYTVAP